MTAAEQVERIFREEHGRDLAALINALERCQASRHRSRATTLERSLVILDPQISQDEPEMDDIQVKRPLLKRFSNNS